MSQDPRLNPLPTLNYAPPARNDLRTIAVRQRAVILCILGYLGCFAAQFAFPENLRLIPALAAFAISVTGAVFVFMLAMALYSTGMGIFLGILTLIPLIGLIVLLNINGRATKVLRRHGIHVGLLRARKDQIPTAGQPLR